MVVFTVGNIMIHVAEARPPYVTFEMRAVEDREATIAEGRYVAKDVAFTIITPQGSKDRIERVASEWFAQLGQQSAEGRFPIEWKKAFEASFADWLAGNEPALNGTDVRNWPAVSPSQVTALRNARVYTVEDLAAANEETLGRIGMGGRALKERANQWLASAVDVGKTAERAAALEAEVADLRKANQALADQVAQLKKTSQPAKP